MDEKAYWESTEDEILGYLEEHDLNWITITVKES